MKKMNNFKNKIFYNNKNNMEKNNSYKPFLRNNNIQKNSNALSKTSSSFGQKLKNTYTTSEGGVNVKMILITILILVIICIIIYLIICYVNYKKVTCYEKRNFVNYIIDFSNSDVCLIEKAPVPEKPKELPPPKPIINFLPEKKKEVFHLSNQDYTYDQSKCKCESYGARLATKAEVIEAYNNGGNWCTYGWSEGQNAYYPVQQCNWDKISKENERLPDKNKKFCGLPGINGGHFPNPLIKFGVNCFGIKPKGELNKPKEPYCPPMNFCKLETNYEASHKLDSDEIAGFNDDKWSMNINK